MGRPARSTSSTPAADTVGPSVGFFSGVYPEVLINGVISRLGQLADERSGRRRRHRRCTTRWLDAAERRTCRAGWCPPQQRARRSRRRRAPGTTAYNAVPGDGFESFSYLSRKTSTGCTDTAATAITNVLPAQVAAAPYPRCRSRSGSFPQADRTLHGGRGLHGPARRRAARSGRLPPHDVDARQLLRDRRVAPSILSADFARLGAQVGEVMAAGARVIHVDVMDGHFVPPITIGSLIVGALADQVHAAGGIARRPPDDRAPGAPGGRVRTSRRRRDHRPRGGDAAPPLRARRDPRCRLRRRCGDQPRHAGADARGRRRRCSTSRSACR